MANGEEERDYGRGRGKLVYLSGGRGLTFEPRPETGFVSRGKVPDKSPEKAEKQWARLNWRSLTSPPPRPAENWLASANAEAPLIVIALELVQKQSELRPPLTIVQDHRTWPRQATNERLSSERVRAW